MDAAERLAKAGWTAGSARTAPSCQDRELKLLVLPAAEGALGQEPLPHPFQGQRVGAACPAPLQHVSCDAEEDLARESIVPGMQGR
jgi:hypothetical protein